MSLERVIERFQHLGVSSYEAKAYIALVAAGEPLNGYEVAKRSGVPRSTVYETLSKLVSRSAAYEVRNGDDSVAYVPLSPEHLLDRLGRDFEASLDELREMLPSVAVPNQVHLIHNLTGREALLTRAEDVVAGARSELFVSAWPEELEPLQTQIDKAAERRVDISTMAFGEVEQSVGHTFVHRFSSPEVVLENLGCRLLVVVGDHREALVGGFLEDDAWGAYTDNPAVVMVAIEYIRHDIAMHVLADRLPAEELEDFWGTDPELVRLRADRGAGARSLRRERAEIRGTTRSA